jgi:hypothetical protein
MGRLLCTEYVVVSVYSYGSFVFLCFFLCVPQCLIITLSICIILFAVRVGSEEAGKGEKQNSQSMATNIVMASNCVDKSERRKNKDDKAYMINYWNEAMTT